MAQEGSFEPDDRGVHYGCHEFRDDAERLLAGRAHPDLSELAETHLRGCLDCRRYRQRLAAVYRPPARARQLGVFERDREFAAILARRHEARRPQLRRSAATLGVGLLSTMAALLALSLFVPSLGARLFGPPAVDQVTLGEGPAAGYDARVHIPHRRLTHQAQAFGRVIGGHGELTDAAGRQASADSLTPGTTVRTGDAPLQIALVGRLLANFEPHTVASWNSTSPQLVELGLVAGTLAVRYDRRPEDPILQVRTPSALVRVVGTVFTVSVDGAGRTSVAVLRGRVEVLGLDGGRRLAEVEAGFRYAVHDSSYRDVGRREVAAALPLAEQTELLVSVDDDGELTIEEPERVEGQIPGGWIVPGLSDDPRDRILDRVLDPEAPLTAVAGLGEPVAAADPASGLASSVRRRGGGSTPIPASRAGGYQFDDSLLAELDEAERERHIQVKTYLERCRALSREAETRFRAARCLGDFMKRHGREPEAVEGLMLLGTLRMDFAHDYQSATLNFEEFLRRAPEHPQAELARYKLVLAAIDAGYIDGARQRARSYLREHPDGEYVGRILQRFPELKAAL